MYEWFMYPRSSNISIGCQRPLFCLSNTLIRILSGRFWVPSSAFRLRVHSLTFGSLGFPFWLINYAVYLYCLISLTSLLTTWTSTDLPSAFSFLITSKSEGTFDQPSFFMLPTPMLSPFLLRLIRSSHRGLWWSLHNHSWRLQVFRKSA